MENVNGRLDLINNVPNMPFILHDKIPVNRNTGFREALNGNLINNTLSNLFFLLKILLYYKTELEKVYMTNLMVNT